MPIYKYEVLVDLPDLAEAKAVIHLIHAAVCGGATEVDEEGNIDHTCAREWQASVHGFTPIVFDEEGTPVIAEGEEWDESLGEPVG